MEYIFIDSFVLSSMTESILTPEYIKNNCTTLIPDIDAINDNLVDYHNLYTNNIKEIKYPISILSILHKYDVKKYYALMIEYIIWHILKLEYKPEYKSDCDTNFCHKFVPQILHEQLCSDIIYDIINYNKDFTNILEYLFFDKTDKLNKNDFVYSIALYQSRPIEYRHKWICPINLIKYGLLDVLQYIVAKNDCNTYYICRTAAEFGQLHILKWARVCEFPWDELTCKYAAKYGHLDVLKWAHENGCPWNTLTCTDAVACGHFEIVKWAKLNGCPWDMWTSFNAVRYGHFEILKWVLENGCPIDVELCSQYAVYYPEIKNWLEKYDQK